MPDPGPSRTRSTASDPTPTQDPLVFNPRHKRPRRDSMTAVKRARPQLGHLASWTVSSHKYGFGVDNLRDGNEGTFWQSEGPQPHLIDLSFPKRVLISAISFLASHPKDDSYTPSKISVRCGTTVHDLQEVRLCEFNQPNGWQHIALRPTDDSGEEAEGPPISAHHLRVTVLANHLNGKDTHVRGLRIFGVPAGSTVAPDGSGSGSLSRDFGVTAYGDGGMGTGPGEGHVGYGYEDEEELDWAELVEDLDLSNPNADTFKRGESEKQQRERVQRKKAAERRLIRDEGGVGFTSAAFRMHQVVR